jgi:hypothetical protein
MNKRDRRPDVHDEPDDTELEEELRRVAALLDPVPSVLLQAAVEAFAWRTIDDDLAELVFDSLVDHEAALVRGFQDRRLLSFHTSDVCIEIEVTSTGASRALNGQLVPPQPASVDIRHRNGLVTLESDALGRFSASSLRAGPISLRCRPAPEATGRAVVTDWVSI